MGSSGQRRPNWSVEAAVGARKAFKVLPAGAMKPEWQQSFDIVACETSLEEALFCLVQAIGRGKAATQVARNGKKPVVLHSLRVAHRLLHYGYEEPVVIAGLLHDVLERSDLTFASLNRRFGAKVANLVAAVTKDPRIGNPTKRYEDSLRRCAAWGEGALAVRVADLLDNCDRALALDLRGRYSRLDWKLKLMVGICREHETEPELLAELRRRQRLLARVLATPPKSKR